MRYGIEWHTADEQRKGEELIREDMRRGVMARRRCVRRGVAKEVLRTDRNGGDALRLRSEEFCRGQTGYATERQSAEQMRRGKVLPRNDQNREGMAKTGAEKL